MTTNCSDILAEMVKVANDTSIASKDKVELQKTYQATYEKCVLIKEILSKSNNTIKYSACWHVD